MTFITLETRRDFATFYEDGQILSKSLPKNLDRTWSFNNFSDNHETTIAQLLAECQELRTAAPEKLREKHKDISDRIKGSLQTFKTIGMSTKSYNLTDLVPKWQLLELGEISAEIVDGICNSRERQPYYSNLVDINRVIYDISRRPIRFDAGAKQGYVPKESTIRYKMFNSKTCRLTTGKDSFPMNLQKELRKFVVPENDGFVEIDVNGMDIRVFIALLGREQPEEDIHVFNQDILGVTERSEAKQRFFSWFYDPTKKNKKLENFYDRTILLDKFGDREYNLITPYKKQLQSDDFHWLNHLVQTTASMIFWEQSARASELLRNRPTYIKMLNHDSILLDYNNEDEDILGNLLEAFSDTRFGKFKCSMTKWNRWCDDKC
jgi:hypothetical protein